MKAMILAAGRGDRMRPLTDHTPKPLLPIAGKPMIEYTIEALVEAGFNELIINVAHLGRQIEDSLGCGDRFGARIQFSREGEAGLETAGGILHALPMLGNDPFLVVNGDIATDYPFSQLKSRSINQTHLILVHNPEHHSKGDFGIEDGYLQENSKIRYTYSGIGIYQAEFFAECLPGKQRLAPLLRRAMSERKVTGELYKGFWMDIGTPKRLMELENFYTEKRKDLCQPISTKK